MTAVQWKTLADVLADLCRRCGIPVTPKTVLSHAEVHANPIVAEGVDNVVKAAPDALKHFGITPEAAASVLAEKLEAKIGLIAARRDRADGAPAYDGR